ncbi:uncharacterized protein VTP21DRAFT_11508 [Calcarisporiella thermophila]|uniref:uncharacterized protein n=1 Tax=Calcarisporiella thermophila TaxID=911321 RepID=UPI003744772D
MTASVGINDFDPVSVILQYAQNNKYTTLATLQPGVIVDIIGVVSSAKPPQPTKGSDFSRSMTIVDPTKQDQEVRVLIFAKSISALPDVRDVGDIVLFHRLKAQMFQGKIQLISSWDATWVVLEASNENSAPRYSIGNKRPRLIIGPEESKVIRVLRTWWRDLTISKRQTAKTMGGYSRKLEVIANIKPGMYMDLYAEVLEVSPLQSFNSANYVYVYFTDYTTNTHLKDVQLISPEQGVMGKRVIRGTLWDQNAVFAAKLSPGNFVYLRNAKSKLDDGLLVLVLHGDKLAPEKVSVSIVDKGSMNLWELLKRRRAHKEEIKELWKQKSNTSPPPKINVRWYAGEQLSTKTSAHGRRVELISNLQPGMYLDLYAEILEISPMQSSASANYAFIYVTDYTTNELLKDTQLISPDQSIMGRRVLRITLWEKNAEISTDLAPGDFVFLRNGKTRMDDGYLVVAVHGDKTDPERVMVRKIAENDPILKEILERKEKHREEIKREWEETMLDEIPSLPPASQVSPSITTLVDSDAPLSTFKEIFACDQIVNKFRIRARVVDILPRQLQDFTRPMCRNCDTTYEPRSDIDALSCVVCEKKVQPCYIYRFVLLLEDEESSTMPVIVYGEDACDFLADLPPSNLYQDNAALMNMQECLSTLFDGEKPAFFECYIKSYEALDALGDVRIRYRMFGTVLNWERHSE